MPCCVVMLALMALPRASIFFLWLLTDYISRAYQTALWPLLGFFFMPYTVLAYAFAMHNGGLQGIGLVVFVIAVLIDLGVVGGSARGRQQQMRAKYDDEGLKRVN